MKNPEDCTCLADIRLAIDCIDKNIVQALGQRMAYVKAASRFKPCETSIAAPERVAAMLPERARWARDHGLDPVFIERMFSQLIDWYISEQTQHWRRVRGLA